MEDQSKLTFKQMLSALLRSNRRHARYIQAFACLAVLVAVAVPLVMRQYGVAMTTTETRLACQYAGNGAHTHNADCYDAYGNLVCPLPEKPFHTHTADCYATERVLTCALPETAGHAHTDACYDEDGNLTCTIPEEPAHTHTDACYETRRTDQLICGMEETTEEHVHGPACFETVTVQLPDPEPETDPAAATPAEPEATVPSTPEEDPTPAQEFSDVLKKKDQNGNEYVYLVVQVKAPQGALPKGSTMAVAHVDLNKKDDLTGLTAQEKLDEVLHKEAGEEAAFVQTDAVDITFKDAQGNRVDPAKKVEVRVTTSMIRTFSDQRTANDEAVANNSLLVLHVVDKQQTKRTDAPNAELIRKAYLVNQDEKDTSTGHEDTIVFEAQEFSPYIVARVNNAALAPEPEPEPEPEAQPAESEQPAAEATLDLTAEDQPAEAEPERPAQSFTHRFTDTNGQVLMRVDVLAPEGAFPLGTTMQVKWVDASHIEESVTQAVSERTDGKLRDMRAVDITFIDADGHEIEPAKKITVTFASDLIDTQDDAYVVHVDDEGKSEVIDALGSKELEKREMPDQADELVFESDAFSTYVVAVTTLHKELAASDGATYDIMVDAPAEAGIPQDAELRVSEIMPGTVGYEDYLYQALQALGEDATADNTALARFFDIKIYSGENEVQPQAPVKVSVKLADQTPKGATASAVHFEGDVEGTTEVLDASSEGDVTTFDATGFSVYGVIYTVDFHWDVDGQTYDFSIQGGDTLSLRELLVALSVIPVDEAEDFMSQVADVTFSDPELVAVAKVDEDTTAGELKAELGVATQYSAQLKADELAEMDAKALSAGDWALVSLKAFDTTETLTITMTNGDTLTIKVTDAQLYASILTADGETWHITITYDDSAKIPDDAELIVKEVLPEDETYDGYASEATEIASNDAVEQGIETPYITGARVFDIEIQSSGKKVEPATPVKVDIELANTKADLLSVVHFAEGGAEFMTVQDSSIDFEESVGEVRFEAASFSVYTVVPVTNFANIANDGPYALVSGIADDRGEAGWSESWGTDFFTRVVNAHSVSDSNFESGIASDGVHYWKEDGTGYVGGNAVQWYFESVGNNQYIAYVEKEGTKYYLDQAYDRESTVSLSMNRDWATKLSITANADGTILIHNGNWYLHNNKYSNSSEWSSRNYKMEYRNSAPTAEEYKFRLCKEAEDTASFAAKKVAASTLTSEDEFLIYRKFVDETGNEALYALADDGSFVRLYDGGESVYWRETEKNIYWHLSENDGTYSIYSEDPDTHDRTYLAPSKSGNQTTATTATIITPTGIYNGEYGSAIENWDQAAYDYAGLHVELSNGTPVLTAGTRGTNTSDTFLFAISSTMPAAEKEKVDTVDSESLGVHITMYDYANPNHKYNDGQKLDQMTNVAGSADYTPHAAHAIVKSYLENGVPSSTSNGAMTSLFPSTGDFLDQNPQDNSLVTYVKTGVTDLFLQSYYDESGTFRYRSEDNYAYLKRDGETTSFDVYRQVGTPDVTNVNVGHAYFYHGHFMPFNDLDTSATLSRLLDQYGTSEIPLGDGRSYEDIYGISGIPNYYTGMKMEANFTQPRDGKLENGDDMIFKFTGDDDMWVYIDGILVLDIGGVHEPLSGTINFHTGVVTNPVGSSLNGLDTNRDGKTTLYEIYQAARNGAPQDVQTKIDSIRWKDVDGDGTPDTFADYTNHSFSSFYMERGGGASNLDIQFNLKVVLTNQFTVEKEVPDTIDERFANDLYKFRATYKDSDGEKPLFAGINGVCTAVVYKDRVDGQGNPVPVAVDTDGYFYLKAGEAAVFMMANGEIEYNVREVDINSTLNPTVEINDQPAQVSEGVAEAGPATVEDRSLVNVKNHPKVQNLKITKFITEDSAPIEDNENPVFEFRVYLESTVLKDNGQTTTDGTSTRRLIPYANGEYYLVKDGYYYTLDGPNNTPVKHGTDPVVCGQAGRSGSINSIPPEYTVVIPNLPVGTNFYLEERRDNIPEGYEFVREVLQEDTYDNTNLDVFSDEAIHRILARDETDHQEFDPHTVGKIKYNVDAESRVYNRKPILDITVEKEWKGDVTTGTSTMVLYQSTTKPSNTFTVTIAADPAPVTTSAGYIDVSYTGTKADGTEDSGSFRLNNENGWSNSLTFAKGSSYTFTYTADGSKITSVTPNKTGEFATDTTVTLTTAVAPVKQYEYAFTVPLGLRSGLPAEGGITVTCNGSEKIASVSNDWTVAFQVAEDTAVSYSINGDGTYIASVDPASGSYGSASDNKTIEMTPTATRVYTFIVPEASRPADGKGSITVVCNGEAKTVNAENDWIATFRLAEGTVASYSATADNKFIESVAVSPESGATVSSDQTITLTPTLAPTTMTVPVTIAWNEAPATPTTVTFTLTPDKGDDAKTVTMSSTGTQWTHNVENLKRIDGDGNLITWTVGDPIITPTDPNVSVRRTSPATFSGIGSITMTGTVARGMNLSFVVQDGYYFGSNGNTSLKNYQPDDLYNKAGNTVYENFRLPSQFELSEIYDNNGKPLGFIFSLPQMYRNGTGNQQNVTVRTSASNAGYVYNYGDHIWFYGESGDVTFEFIANGPGNQVTVETTRSTASASPMSAPARAMAKAFAAPRLLAAAVPSVSHTFYDSDITDATGDALFTLITAKELPADATPVASVPDGNGGTVSGTQVITNDGSFTWSNLPKTDNQGNPLYYYVVEKDATAVADTISVKYEYEYRDNDPSKGISKVKVINTTTAVPEPEKGNVRVTKIFSGIDELPENFQIAYSYTEYEGEDPKTGTFTVANATSGSGTVDDPYTWTINDLPVGTEVTFTESGMSVNGYNLTTKINGATTTDDAPTGTATVAADQTLTTQFVNDYTVKPGDLELTKKVAGTGADAEKGFDFTIELTAPEDVTLADSYQATLNGVEADPVTFTEGMSTIQVNLKANDVYLIDDLPAGTTYTITESDYTAEGYSASTTRGELSGTITGGTTAKTAVEVTNTYSAVEINIIKIDETTRTAATQKKLSGAKFELYKWTTTDGDEMGGNYTAYPSAETCEQTSGTDGKLSFGKLPNGKYKIVETHAPDGYVAYSAFELYFTISADSTLTWTNSEGETITEQSLVKYSSTDKAFIVGNTPGAELPQAGGPGTLLHTLCGLALFAAAGYVGLASKRNARKEVA